jgi:biopolymer transport protein ExbD
MKFPRNARIFRGQLDFAPFAAVLFLLVVFVLLGKMLYTPGIPVRLPATGDLILPGAAGPTLSVAVTTNAFYFEDERVPEDELSNRLFAAKQKIAEPVTLIVQSDEDVTEKTRAQLWAIAQQIGFTNLIEATRPRVFDPSSTRSTPP